TTEKFKRFKRWKHEAVLEAMQRRLDAMPDAMAIRRATVEHVFGTLQAWMGSRAVLTRRRKGVRTGRSRAILAYSMKRMLRLCGATRLVQAIRA
ncbi:IS5/IS1182 family transposase, partial [Methylobacterium sp. J-030]|nr:IS5/IS1182 family transposase [Methylobacterium sp. J-030]